MATVISGNFAANGDSVEFIASKFVICLGTDTNANFGGGTVSVKSRSDDKLDWTTDTTTYTAMDLIKQDCDMLGSKFKITLSGATSPNIDYTIRYE